MRAEILAIGTEILLGDIINTNAQYIARRLADLGIFVYHQSVVGDNEARVKDAFALAFSRAELVITTGGLGPTKDDLTKEMAAEYFSRELVLHEPTLDNIEAYFKKRNRIVNEGNRKQAYFPKDALILENHHGTAPGCIIEEDDKVLIVMPGPPSEMIPMFENTIVPYLQKYEQGVLVSKVLRICGIGEGHMEEKIQDIMISQSNPTVAPYAKEGEVTVRITARANTKEEAQSLITPVEMKIRERLGEDVYGEDETTIEGEVVKLLIGKNLTIATAESCSGGLLSGKIINFPGASAVFMEGAITYSNDAKIRRLNVKEATLQQYGAVSEQCAAEMAEGIAKAAGTNIGVSITGIAGPDGGSEEKPVGLVYVGLYYKDKVAVKVLNLPGDRMKIRNRTVTETLDWIRREIK